MSHVLELEPVDAYWDDKNTGGSLRGWLGSVSFISGGETPESAGKTPEEMLALPTAGRVFVHGEYQILANRRNVTDTAYIDVVVSTPIHTSVDDGTGTGNQITRALFQRYATDVTVPEFTQALENYNNGNTPTVRMTREGLLGIRAVLASKPDIRG